MRIRKRAIILFLLFVALSWRYHRPVTSTISSAWSTLRSQRFQDETSRLTSFSLERDHWVTFKIPSQSSTIRALTNAALSEMPAHDVFTNVSRPGWRYSVDYQLLDAAGDVIRESTYHFRSNISQYRDPKTGEVFSPSFFRNSSQLPIQTRTMTIALHDQMQRPAHQLRLRLAHHEPEIAAVVARVTSRVANPNAESTHAWTRLSLERRKRLSRPNVYSHDLLTQPERQNLIRWTWQQSVPVGVANRDFTPRIMYTIDNIVGDELGSDVTPVRFIARSDLRATIPVPPGLGSVRLNVTPIDSTGWQLNGTVSVAWFGTGLHSRSLRQLRVAEMQSGIEVSVDGGLIEIESSVPLEIKAQWTSAGETNLGDLYPLLDVDRGVWDITPEPLVVTAYGAADDSQVQYSIYHADGAAATAFRIAGRAHLNQANGDVDQTLPANIQLRWLTRSADGETLDSGVVNCPVAPSIYDYVRNGNLVTSVGDPMNAYFSLSSDVATIEFSTSHPCLVTGYCRPANAVKTNVPQDYAAFQRRAGLNRKWFAKRALNHYHLEADQRLVSVRVQSRPPQDDTQIVEGDYTWEDFRPTGEWRGRFLLLPQDVDTPMRREAINASWWELPLNSSQKVTAISDEQQTVIPRLIYSANSAAQVAVEFDRQEVLAWETRSSSGQRSLPEVDVDGAQHVLTLKTNGISANARMFVSGLQAADCPRFLKRLAQIPNDGTLCFDVEKRTHEAEVLMLRTYTTDATAATTNVRVEINVPHAAAGSAAPVRQIPQTDWTFLQREYTIENDIENEILSPGHAGKFYAGRNACFIALGEDLPPGIYRIKIQSTGDTCFVLYRTTAGRSDELRVYQGVDSNR